VISNAIKLSMSISPQPEAGEVAFAAQLGVRYVYSWLPDTSFQTIQRFVETADSADLKTYNLGNIALGKSANIHLGLPDRDRDIDAFAEFLRNLSRAGIHRTTFTWEPDRVWTTHKELVRGGAVGRAVSADDLATVELTRGRRYEREELWDNFAYFMERIIPVAEETGVRLALHPNDPPVDEIAGIACLIRSASDYRRAFEIADSDTLGMEFCMGCWLEGGESGFGNIHEGIREFRDRILIVHFRNISGPLPEFTETFVDEGYGDMFSILETLRDVGYDGSLIYDHTPQMTEWAGKGAAAAYAIGYIKASLARL
jgi:mannonate dehydratase